jgi:C-lobe and N-lobe beta barrels of Tf-binding protein B
MRHASLLALVASSLSLAACASGGDSGTLGSAYDMASSGLPLCGLSCDVTPDGGGSGGGDPAPEPDSDGDGIPDGSDTDGSTGSGAGGNTTNLTPVTGARTIALEDGQLVVPTRTGATSLATLSMTNTLSTATNTAAVASILTVGSKPTQLKIGVDTEGTGNSQWPVPILMDEYVAIDSTTGLRIPYGSIASAADYFGSNTIDYHNGVGADMNIGSGTDYREYRALSSDRNEVMQVWSWNDSYALQYRNASGGGAGKQQAWTFGGNASTNVPAGGSGTYVGRFAGTAETSNWIKPDTADVDPNALWQVQGATNLTANFTTDRITGTLTPETWTSFQADLDGRYTWNTAGFGYMTNSGAAVNATDGPNYTAIYDTTIAINGTFDPVTGTNPQNSFTGTAKLSGAYSSGDNPMYGGFFGNNGNEVAGVFNVLGSVPDPTGGNDGLTDDRAAYLSISGAFHGECSAAPCAP